MNVSRPSGLASPHLFGSAALVHGLQGIQSARVDAAFAFAAHAHGDQKYGTEPYVVHLQEVMAGCVRMGFTDDASLMAAAMHDVIEDTDVGRAGITAAFGGPVAQLVAELSHDRKVDTVDYLAAMSDGAFSVKLADRLANVERMGLLENSPDRAAYLMAKYGPEMPLFKAEATRRGLEKPFSILEAAFAKTAQAVHGAVDAYALQQGRDLVEAKQRRRLAEADGSASGGAFVAEMGGKKAAQPTSLSPMMAVRQRPTRE